MSHPVVPPHDGGHPPGRGHYGPEPGWGGNAPDWPAHADGPPVARPAPDASWWSEAPAHAGPADATAHWAAPAHPGHDDGYPDHGGARPNDDGGWPDQGGAWPEQDGAWPDQRTATWSQPPVHPEPAHPEQTTDTHPAPTRRRAGAGRLVLHIGLALLVGLGVFAIKSMLFGDPTRHAEAGDCVATEEAAPTRQRTDAKVVDCGAADARFTVAGRVDGAAGTDDGVCDQFFQPEEQFWVYSSEASGGYVLCLRPKAAAAGG